MEQCHDDAGKMGIPPPHLCGLYKPTDMTYFMYLITRISRCFISKPFISKCMKYNNQLKKGDRHDTDYIERKPH